MPNVRILIVEDDLIVAQSIEIHLKSLGYEVPAIVTTGQEAIHQAGEIRPNLVLMDIKLPGEMDGVEAAAEIRSNYDIPVIYLTAYADEKTLARAKITGPFGYILKPFGGKELHSTIEMALYKHRAERQVEHLNRVLRAIRSVNQLITREKDQDRLLKGACECLVQTRGYHSAWIAGIDESGRVVTVAQAGMKETFSSLVEQLKQGERPGCWREAMAQPGVFSIEDPLSTCAGCLFEEKYRGGRKMAVRLGRDEQVYGMLVVYLPAELVTDEEERTLFKEVATDIAFALHNIQEEEKRKRAEEALQQSEHRYRRLLESVTDYIYTVKVEDGQPAATSHGPGCEAVTGYTPEEYAADPHLWYQMIYPEDREAVTEQATRLIAGETVPPLEHRLVHKDGSLRWVRNTPVPRYDENEHLVAYDGLIADITERKQAEEEAQKSRDQLQSIFRAAPIGIGVVIDRTATFVNQRFIEMLGYTRDELIGQNARMIYPSDEEYEWVGREKYEQIREKGIGTLETRLKCKDGKIIDILLSSCPINPQDLSQGVTFTALDITERKQAEEEKEKLQSQLLQAQKMEAIGRLTGGIAHDFNNLLTAINGFAELAQHKLAPDDPLQDMLGYILASGQRAADLIRQLLAFSSKQIIEPKIVSLNSLITDLEAMLLRRIIGEDIQIETTLASDLWPIKVDPAQIEQVIVNLAVNARDAMPDGGKLTIETANVVLDNNDLADQLEIQPGEYILLAVSDTGKGMSEVVLEHIFEPFFTTKERDKGTGLGLATVYGIVKQNEGDIKVYSEEDQGTTFKIYLPHAGEALQSAPRAKIKGKMPVGSETILLVEDDAQVRDLARQILAGQGYKVLETENGREALQLTDRYPDPIHLLLTDVVMPDINGRALAEQLLQTRPNLKTIFISGYTDETIAHHGVLDPEITLLQKPFSPMDLARKVREILDAPG
jgi:two-component system cell cycle sensor histidine kinase/response regulator CckA